MKFGSGDEGWLEGERPGGHNVHCHKQCTRHYCLSRAGGLLHSAWREDPLILRGPRLLVSVGVVESRIAWYRLDMLELYASLGRVDTAHGNASSQSWRCAVTSYCVMTDSTRVFRYSVCQAGSRPVKCTSQVAQHRWTCVICRSEHVSALRIGCISIHMRMHRTDYEVLRVRQPAVESHALVMGPRLHVRAAESNND